MDISTDTQGRRRVGAQAFAVVTAMLVTAPATQAQPLAELHLGYAGAVISTSDWSPGYGPSIGVGVGGDRAQIRIEYGWQARDGGRVDSYCEFFGCVEGPFEESRFVRAFRLGIARSAYRTQGVELVGVLQGGYFVQGRHMTRIDDGDEFDRGSASDFGLGVALEARVTEWGERLAPKAWIGYERIRESECPADGTCYRGRNRFELGLGLSWRRPF